MIKVNIYFDIETLPPELSDREMVAFKENLSPPGNIKKPETIQKWIEDNWEEKYRKMATDTAIADFATFAWNFTGDPKDTTCVINTERNNKAIINAFFDDLKQHILNISKEEGIEVTEEDIKDDAFLDYVKINWYGTNIRTFDLDLLWKKAILFKMFNLSKLIPRKKFDDRVIDLVEVFNGPSTHKYTSQEEICKMFGIKGKPDDIDGSQVFDYWMAGEYEKIAEYNIFDVNRVIELSTLFNV
tara:strand:- start:624 stop:1352 length:729 start_codon:yes stop_codon:yes gene_type:complete